MHRKSTHCCAGWLLALVLSLIACDTGATQAEEMDRPPDGVRVTNDLTYAVTTADRPGDQALDVYGPIESGDWPVAVVLHGGSGSRKQFQYAEFSRRLAQQGVVVFNISYAAPGAPEPLLLNNGRHFREVLETTVCAIRYARQHADVYGGNPSRLSVIGQSAGGLFGSLASFLGEDMHTTWEAFEATRGTPPDQMTCVADSTDASVQGFVGFNGAYFIFVSLGLPQDDPELWSLANLENYIGKNPSLTARFILGENDNTQPAWHIERINGLVAGLRNAGYNAEAPVVQAAHNFTFDGPGWDETLEVVLDVVRR